MSGQQQLVGCRNDPQGYCLRCQELMSFDGFVQLFSKAGFEHLTERECSNSAKRGCPLCTLFCGLGLFMGWDPEEPLVLFLEPGVEDAGLLAPGKSGNYLTDWMQRPPDESTLLGRPKYHEQQRRPAVSAALFTTDADPAAKFIRSRPPLGYTDESKVLAAAKAWIEDCRRNHTNTCPLNRSVALPLRLIDVGDDMIAPDVRLVLPKKGETGEYVALSYCWGGPQPVTTTRGNLDSMRERMKLKDLPQTLKDAVRITRAIGQRYLWVDALCIIQDSKEDKQHEIQKMGLIYRNAALAISAAAASAVSEGFLGRQPEPLPSLRWQLDIPGKGMHTIFISAIPFGSRSSYQPNHPLDRRGWALQESMLSPRLLVFSEHEPIWQCRFDRGRSRRANPASYLNYADLSQPSPSWLFAERVGLEPWRSLKDQQKLWGSIVYNFTQRLLTNNEDRLNAVAGIAAELQRRWEDEYLYGHWKESFLEQLLWFTNSPSSVSRLGIAPTWSWGSIDATVSFSNHVEARATAQVLDATDGFPRVRLSCRTKNPDSLSKGSVKCRWDSAVHASSPPPGAKLMQLASFTSAGGAIMPVGIIGTPINESCGAFRRVGFFTMSYCLPYRTWQRIWEAVELEQILVQ